MATQSLLSCLRIALSSRSSRSGLLLAAGLLAFGCETYDPPPEPGLTLPESGTYQVGEALTMTFSEGIVPSTLSINVWNGGPESKDIEGQFVAGFTPTVAGCTVASCDGGSLSVDEVEKTATLELTHAAFAKAKVPWILEVKPGLKDGAGRVTRASEFFDFQFAPSSECGTDPVPFESGIFVLVANITEPLPATLILFNDIQANELGSFQWAGGKAKALEGFAKNTSNPEEMYVDETADGFGLFAGGCITLDGDDRFLATEPIDITLAIGPIQIILQSVRITGAIQKNPESGQDRIEGTISFSGLVLDTGNGEPFDYPAGNAPFAAEQVPDALVPEQMPRLCGDLCGTVTAQCNPPADWPSLELCPAE